MCASGPVFILFWVSFTGLVLFRMDRCALSLFAYTPPSAGTIKCTVDASSGKALRNLSCTHSPFAGNTTYTVGASSGKIKIHYELHILSLCRHHHLHSRCQQWQNHRALRGTPSDH